MRGAFQKHHFAMLVVLCTLCIGAGTSESVPDKDIVGNLFSGSALLLFTYVTYQQGKEILREIRGIHKIMGGHKEDGEKDSSNGS